MQSVYLCIHFARFSIYYIIISIIISFNRGRGDFIAKDVFRFEMHIFIIFGFFFFGFFWITDFLSYYLWLFAQIESV